jgi:hypothetical protein
LNRVQNQENRSYRNKVCVVIYGEEDDKERYQLCVKSIYPKQPKKILCFLEDLATIAIQFAKQLSDRS